MPQLDTLSFTSQVFWFLFVYIVTYFLLSYLYLPKVTAVLTLRADLHEVVRKMSSEVIYLKKLYENYLMMVCQEEILQGLGKTRLQGQQLDKQYAKIILGLEKGYQVQTMETVNTYLVS